MDRNVDSSSTLPGCSKEKCDLEEIKCPSSSSSSRPESANAAAANIGKSVKAAHNNQHHYHPNHQCTSECLSSTTSSSSSSEEIPFDFRNQKPSSSSVSSQSPTKVGAVAKGDPIVGLLEGIVLEQMGLVSKESTTRREDDGKGLASAPVEEVEPIEVTTTTSSSTSSTDDTDDTSTTTTTPAKEFRGKGKQGLAYYYSSSLRHALPSPPSAAAQDVVPMTVDTCEDLWTRLHDIRINGCVLEYVGPGKSIYDNGIAQSNTPLTPLNHYFEVTIVHPGESCYIAIGLARKDYPVNKHPGWNRGSIAYHADDGKIFIGSGVGTPFGPRCNLNDVLGCGIVFPSKMNDSAIAAKAGCEWPWEVDGGSPAKKAARSRPPRGYHHRYHHHMENIMDPSSESEDDIWWNNRNQVYEDKVQVFFMRNGKLLGIKEIRIPKGGFYPTIGMMSLNEKVMIDMSPLSG